MTMLDAEAAKRNIPLKNVGSSGRRGPSRDSRGTRRLT
jgi:hypothetical protein